MKRTGLAGQVSAQADKGETAEASKALVSRRRRVADGDVGMDMGMGSNAAGEGAEEAPQTPQKPRCRGGLRGMAERAAGLCE